MEGLNPLMPLLTMVKTCMSGCIFAGLLARGTLSRAIINSIPILNYAAHAFHFFNGTTHDDDGCFVWHRIASFQYAASLRAYRCTQNSNPLEDDRSDEMVDSWISSRDLSPRRLLLFCFQRQYTIFREMPRAGNKTSLLKKALSC